jgi:hypothetical protein
LKGSIYVMFLVKDIFLKIFKIGFVLFTIILLGIKHSKIHKIFFESYVKPKQTEHNRNKKI